jgi:hypothetical protein
MQTIDAKPFDPEPGAFDLKEFCARYRISRATAFLEIKARRLKPSYVGRKLIISPENARAWLASLPSSRSA